MIDTASVFRAGVLVVSSMTLTAAAHATGDRPVSARVTVAATEACASDAAFWRATTRRTDRLREATSEDADVALDVVVRSTAGGASGEVRITRGGRTFAERRMTGASCDDVLQALSLVVALAFDPAAKTDSPPEADAEVAPPAAGATSEASEPSQGPVIVASPEPAERPAPAPSAARDRRTWRFGIGGHASAIGLAAPAASLGYGGFVDLERDAEGLSPSFRAGVLRSNGEAVSNGVDAEITWTLARASACPLRFDLAERLSLRPCLGIDAGSMAGRATGLERSRERARPWVAATAAARLAWSPVRSAFVEVEGGGAVPFVRDELAVDPSVSLYRAPSFVPSAQFGAGVRFP